MQSVITRLALFQFLTTFYSIIGIGMMVKLRYGSPAPDIFATHLRDYGVLLLFVPAVWLTWASISAHRPLAGAGDFGPILQSGLIVLGLLVVLALIGTFSAARSKTGTLLRSDPEQHPPALHSQK